MNIIRCGFGGDLNENLLRINNMVLANSVSIRIIRAVSADSIQSCSVMNSHQLVPSQIDFFLISNPNNKVPN